MTDVLVERRAAWPPNRVLDRAKTSAYRYGFQYMQPNAGSFALPRSHEFAQQAAEGDAVSFARDDGNLPWFGYITQIVRDLGSAQTDFQVHDVAGAVLGRAVTDSCHCTGPVTRVLADVWAEADGRAYPPLVARLDVAESGGPAVSLEARADGLLAFINRLAEMTGWEWRLDADSDGRPVLRFVEAFGRDWQSEVVFEEGKHFEKATRTQSTEGRVGRALVIGGDAPLLSRPQETADNPQSPRSPASAGTRLDIVRAVADPATLRVFAERLARRSEQFVADRFELALIESAVSVEKLEIGGYYGVRSGTLGVSVGAVARCLGLSVEDGGTIGFVGERVATPREVAVG